MKTFGLAELLHPLSTEVFMSRYWQKQPYVRHGPLERFKEIATIRALRSIEAILEVWRGAAEAWAPRDTKNPVITARTTRRTEFPLEGTLALRYIARKRRFYGHEVASAIEPNSAEHISEILETLEKSGLIIRTSHS